MNRYGSITPPEFDLSRISGIPIAVLFGSLDNENTYLDREWFMEQINDVVVFNRTYQNYAHF